MSAALAPGSPCTVVIAGKRIDGLIRGVTGTGITATVRLDTGEVRP